MVTIAAIQKAFKSSPLLQQEFINLYTRSISKNSLNLEKNDPFVTFLKDRFSYFKKAKLKNIEFELNKIPDKQDLYYIETVMPDAQFLLITLETILKKYHFRIKKMYHPILSATRNNQGQLKKVESSDSRQDLVSCIYIEIDTTDASISLADLKKHINRSLHAVHAAQLDHDSILDKVKTVQESMKKMKEPLPKFHSEWIELFDWLTAHNFSFYGYATFTNSILDKKSGCGILSQEHLKIDDTNLDKVLHQHVKQLANYRSPFLFDVIKVKSPIQRFENLMRLSIKLRINDKQVIEHTFLGLLKRSSLNSRNLETPIIRQKINAIFKQKKLIPGSYDFNQCIRLFTSIPKFELFRTPTENLLEMIDQLLSLTNPEGVFCFTRKSISPVQLFYMIVIPPELFTSENKSKIINYLTNTIPHKDLTVVEAQESLLCRLHFHFEVKEGFDAPKPDNLGKEIEQLIMSWDDKLRVRLQEIYSPKEASRLYKKYVYGFPGYHRFRRTPKESVRDIYYIEKMLKEKQMQFNLSPFEFPDSILKDKASILFIYTKEKIDLILIMPILQNLGIHIFDEITTRMGTMDDTFAYIHSFRAVHDNGEKIQENDFKALFSSLMHHLYQGHIANDPLNALIFKIKLNWRQIMILQTYRELYLQQKSPYSRQKLNKTLLKHPELTQKLALFFETKFNPDLSLGSAAKRQKKQLPHLQKDFFEALTHVSDITEDLIVRHFFWLIEYTLRTNYYIEKKDEYFISIKLDSNKIKMPGPLPYREIFVYDAHMQGIHLRFGPVSRGGLRWSDRPDDFRTEVLGLASAQQTKNACIVPEGSKGGFIITKPSKDISNIHEESQIQYKKFIRALLDITDNIVKDKVLHPKNVLIYDTEDPYLVVAADKGTAQFSDIANEISNEYNFWLDDGFASGGSYGYNHKEVGITAKGAWESVKLHFAEMGKDCQKEPFSVVGVGDMAGDVFGNGMLLSRQICLKAAFNHMHIFIDPEPDPETSFKERERLFNLPKSSWTDYNQKLISTGGGIFDKRSKSIKLTPQIKEMLHIKDDCLNGEELSKAILKMPMDLLWFGGIGTYIKSKEETHFRASDPANDNIRINHDQCQAKVIGEGANLGITQLGRFALAKRKVQLNTDFIDNSAGVTMSDHEVNIKIMLSQLLNAKKIKNMNERHQLLEKATDEVTEKVLINNRYQHSLISMDLVRSQVNMPPFITLLNLFIKLQIIDPKTMAIFSESDMRELGNNKTGLPRPFLALLQGKTKHYLVSELMKSTFLNDPYLDKYFLTYFPQSIREKHEKHMKTHPLKREIIATALANKIVSQAGISFYFFSQDNTQRNCAQITHAYLILEAGLEVSKLRVQILESDISYKEKYKQIIALENILQFETRDLLFLKNLKLSFKLIDTCKAIVANIKTKIDNKELEASVHSLTKKGLSSSIAKDLTIISKVTMINDLLYIHLHEHLDIDTGYQLSGTLDTVFGFEWLKQKLYALALQENWDHQQRELLLQSIHKQKISLVKYCIKNIHKNNLQTLQKKDVIKTFEQLSPNLLKDYLGSLKQLKTGAPINLTSISVVISRLTLLVPS